MAQFGTMSSDDGNTKTSSRIRSRAWTFTWNNYGNLDLAQFAKALDDIGEYVFQEENASTPHLQGVIRFKNPVGIKFQKCFPKCIHWERCRSWRGSVKYCTKRLTRSGKVYHNIDGLIIRESIEDDLAGVELYEWQQNLIDIMKKKPNKRHIYWLWSSEGGVGKTSLIRHLVLKYDAIIVGGSCRDAKFQIIERDKVRDVKIVIFQIPRANINKVSYSAIEEIKDAVFSSPKYESNMVCINRPHVVIFANFEPKYHLLSKDRWMVWNVDK